MDFSAYDGASIIHDQNVPIAAPRPGNSTP
jgi:hypothetical protein